MMKTWHTYNAVRICEVNSKLTHSSNNGQKALDRIVMYNWFICQALFLRISIFMNNSNTQTMLSFSSNKSKNYT